MLDRASRGQLRPSAGFFSVPIHNAYARRHVVRQPRQARYLLSNGQAAVKREIAHVYGIESR